MAWMIVRVRGSIHARRDVVETLRLLHLTRPNHATVVPEEPSFRGMITVVQGYVTWGEADPATVGKLLAARGETTDGHRLGDAAAAPGAPDVATLAHDVSGKGLVAADGLKPLFRLRAPKGGWRSTKKPFARGGALGYRGARINDLVQRML
ncbi:MAG TPA: 50S ribosomal protein L30 [Thermoplasmata archaeon]|nr:50S ribosomal protein L30 [Thermoplasmata archaeon]